MTEKEFRVFVADRKCSLSTGHSASKVIESWRV